MKVDFFSFKYAPQEIKTKWYEAVRKSIDAGIFIGGPLVSQFENLWAEYCECQYAVGVSNGLDGLILALRSLGISVGDKVAVPAHTFIATWNAVIAVGATPVGIDVDRDGLMDLERLQLEIDKVDAVIPVHMHGAMVDMAKVAKMCEEYGRENKIGIVEDASQSHGAVFHNHTKAGVHSDAVVYSLYPTKNLGALGDAGVITTNRKDLAQKLKRLTNYGADLGNKYSHLELGYNNRLDPIQAAILIENLNFLASGNLKRQELSNFYMRELSERVEFLQELRTDSVRHHICILTESRDDLVIFLRSRGIGAEIHYPQVAGIEANRFLRTSASFPVSERISRTTLSLPLSPWHTEDQISYVIEQIQKWLDEC